MMSDANIGPWLQLALLKQLPSEKLATNPVAVAIEDLLRQRNPGNKLEQVLALVSNHQKQLPDILKRQADACLAWSQASGKTLLCQQDPRFPELLRMIPQAPLLLFIQGEVNYLRCPQLAIVGSRKPSAAGQSLARKFGRELSESGYLVTSGLALGIDGAGHEGALNAGKPTIAVLGSGLEQIYPKGHRNLAARIAANGALVSEYPPQLEPKRMHFPQRNRIISGLAHGVLVVEAAESSGSLITAEFALQQGREVFAVPGPVQIRTSQGCHQLLRQGATLVESTRDILIELGALFAWEKERLPPDTSDNAPDNASLTSLQQQLLKQIAYNPVPVDQLVRQLQTSPAELYPALMQLELDGFIVNRAGAYVRST